MQRPDNEQRQVPMNMLQYLAFEEHASVRHEYVSGQIFAMTGATKRHNRITMNIAHALDALVHGTPCQIYSNDIKVQVESTSCFYYPDVMMDCAEFEDNEVYSKTPSLIVEVLSPSTWMIDKREKLVAYKTLDSLQEYLIVHQSKKLIELHRRTQGDLWETFIITPEIAESVLIHSMPDKPIPLSFEMIYPGVQFKAEGKVQEDSAHYSSSDPTCEQADW
jgi:Uma2 family endonuclease